MTDVVGPPLRSFGTGLLQTEVIDRHDGTFAWRRRPGEIAPAAHRVPSDAVTARAREIAPGPVTWAMGAVDGAERVYELRGAVSVAGRLLRDGPDEQLPGLLRGAGELLRRLHDGSVPGDDEAPPPAIDRLTAWLEGRAATPQGAYARSFLRPRLGEDALDQLLSACRGAGAPGQGAVWCHGAPGLGSLVPADDDGATAQLLVGEDVGRGVADWDLGWIVGELVELRWTRPGDPADLWDRALDALFEGYGRAPADGWARPAALRILLHLHDYTSYVRLDRPTVLRYIEFIGFLLQAAES